MINPLFLVRTKMQLKTRQPLWLEVLKRTMLIIGSLMFLFVYCIIPEIPGVSTFVLILAIIMMILSCIVLLSAVAGDV